MALKTRMRPSELMQLSWDIWKCPSFPCKNQRGGVMENSRDPLSSASLWLPLNMQMCFQRELLKRIMTVVLLPCPFQFVSELSGGHAECFRSWDWTPRGQGLFLIKSLPKSLQSSCFCKGWQAQSLWEVFSPAHPFRPSQPSYLCKPSPQES